MTRPKVTVRKPKPRQFTLGDLKSGDWFMRPGGTQVFRVERIDATTAEVSHAWDGSRYLCSTWTLIPLVVPLRLVEMIFEEDRDDAAAAD